MNTIEKIKWCIAQHEKTNHYYDTYLPYEFHLRMANQVAKEFIYLIPNLFTDSDEIHRGIWKEYDRTETIIELACFGHDLIEDTRTSYNECVNMLRVGNYLRTEVADIIYAVTNEKGKNRSERANSKYYEGIKKVNGAVFVKLCDRIANVRYSKMTKSSMYEKYKLENPNFINSLGYNDVECTLKPMFDCLVKLFED